MTSSSYTENMGNVLEFQSARVQLHAWMLRTLGVPNPLSWRVEGRPRDRFWDGGLYAAPFLLASRRAGEACIIDIADGPTPLELPALRMLQATLDIAVIREHLRHRMEGEPAVYAWVVFEDGGRVELEATAHTLEPLREHAQRIMRTHRLCKSGTREIASLWGGPAQGDFPRL